MNCVANHSIFDTVPTPIQIQTSYFLHTVPARGSFSSGPARFLALVLVPVPAPVPYIILRILKIKFLSIIFLLKLDGNLSILTWNSLI